MPLPRVLKFALVMGSVTLTASNAVFGQAAITSLDVYKQTAGSPPSFMVEIKGTSLQTPERPRVLVFPAATVQEVASTATDILVEVKASDANYVPVEVTLSYSTGAVSKPTLKTTCSDADIDKSFLYVTKAQAKKKYGSSVGIYFDVIQVSIVNKCALPVLVPLAGIYLGVPSRPDIHALSLDHVTSIYNNGRTFSSGRAIYFNILQAAATLGSAIQPFFGTGFTQGVSILGGGFTQGSAAIWKDLSAEQLQNLASQSFQSTEQVAGSGGSLQKYVFLPKSSKKDDTVQSVFTKAAADALNALKLPPGSVTPPKVQTLHVEIIPVVSQPPTK